MSWVTLLTAYGLIGRSSFDSEIGSSSGRVRPYSSFEPTTRIRASGACFAHASSRFTCPTMLFRIVSSGSASDRATDAWLARW